MSVQQYAPIHQSRRLKRALSAAAKARRTSKADTPARPIELSHEFPVYSGDGMLVPVRCVTPDVKGAIHRFYDTSPFSPSGRHIALTALPRENTLPKPGDVASIIVVNLETGWQRVVAQTRGWDTQLGAQVQWGASDSELYFNDVDCASWQPFGVRLDPETGVRTRLDGTIYMVSSDGKRALSPCLKRIGATQIGYGVHLPTDAIPGNHGAAADDGIFVTDLTSGRCDLLLSIERIVDEARPKIDMSEFGDGDFYGFHIKWSPDAERIMFVLRYKCGKKRTSQIITCRADGSDIRVALSAEDWARGGSHPNWCADGERIVMNLHLSGQGMRYVTFRYDGSEMKELGEAESPLPHPALLSKRWGHPLLHPNGRTILTDAYSGRNGELWSVDVASGEKRALARIPVKPRFWRQKGAMRIDLHPAWDATCRYVAFNGYAGGGRRVFVADLNGSP